MLIDDLTVFFGDRDMSIKSASGSECSNDADGQQLESEYSFVVENDDICELYDREEEVVMTFFLHHPILCSFIAVFSGFLVFVLFIRYII